MQTTRLGNMVLKALASLLAVLLLAVGIPTAASANTAPGALPTGMYLNVDTIQEGSELTSGTTHNIVFGFNPEDLVIVPGTPQQVTLEFVTSAGLQVAMNQEFIDKIAALKGVTNVSGSGSSVTITFTDNPADLMDGDAFHFEQGAEGKLTVTTSETQATEQEISWTGQTTPRNVLLIPANVEKVGVTEEKITKNSARKGFQPKFTASGSDFGTWNGEVEYIVQYSTLTGGPVNLEDEITFNGGSMPSWLSLGTPAVSYTTWKDAAFGYGEKETVTIPASEVTSDSQYLAKFVLPKNSIATIKYTATIPADKIADAKLALFPDLTSDAVRAAGATSDPVENTATIGAVTTSTETRYTVTRYERPRPDFNGVGTKTGVWKQDGNTLTGNQFANFDASGNPTGPITADFDLKIDFTKFDWTKSTDPAVAADPTGYKLTEDVVITDILPVGATWDSETTWKLVQPGLPPVDFVDVFIQSSNDQPAPGYYYIGQENGRQKLVINFGQSTTAIYTVKAKATYSSLEKVGNPTAEGYQKRAASNTMTTKIKVEGFSSVQTDTDTARIELRDRVLEQGGTNRDVTDESIFNKSADTSVVHVKPGERATVPYQILVNADGHDDVLDLALTEIVDHIDTKTFDVANVPPVVSGEYTNGGPKVALGENDFLVEFINSGADLRIRLSPAGLAKLSPVDGAVKSGKLTVNVELTTNVLNGLQAVSVDNSATYLGKTAIKGNYTSTTRSSASSLGAGVKYIKHVYDYSTDSFVRSLRIPTSQTQAYVDNNFVYKLTVTVDGAYKFRFSDLTDELNRANLDLLGLVDPASVGAGKTPTLLTAQTVDLGRNLQVAINKSTNKVVVGQKSSAFVSESTTDSVFEIYYTAKIKDSALDGGAFPQDKSFNNSLGRSVASFNVTDKYPLSIFKESTNPAEDSDGNQVSLNDPTSSFTVAHEDGTETHTDLAVSNGRVMQLKSDGTYADLLVTKPGKYILTEVKAPAGHFLSTATYEINVIADKTPEPLTIFNEPIEDFNKVSITKAFAGQNPASQQYQFAWTAKVPAGYATESCVGSANANCATDAVAAGKTLTSGTATVFGGATQVIGNFPTGTEITVTEVQFLPTAGYEFEGVEFSGTTGTSKTDAGITSFTFEVDGSEAIALTATNTFVPYVSVGDFVWFDADRDGIQGGTKDQPIAGVELELVGPDGKTVTNIDGQPVANATTDTNGKYLFDRLPVLTGNQQYTVKVVAGQDAPGKPLEGWTSAPKNTTVRENDSDTGQASSKVGGLALGGSKDLTLDFGFVTKSYAVGDVVWVDVNRDGLQGATEAKLAGVTVSITDVAGNPATNVLGAAVPSVTTDADGRYKFDNLPAGEYVVTFKLTAQQNETYMFTKNVSGDSDSSNNSDGVVKTETDGSGTVTTVPDTAITRTIALGDSNDQLTTSYAPSTILATEGIDPTWDAGVHLKNVSIGDLVWVDTNRDGLQDAGEPGIPNVTLEVVLVDSDNKEHPVEDVNGDPVVNQVTDSEGLYNFVNLPALNSGEKYVVRIVKNADTVEALAPYVPTLPGVGTDDSIDSNTDFAEATHAGLQEDEGHNPTLDFGFITKSYAVGDIVWIDANRDGIQDFAGSSPELPLEGVTVELFVEQTDKDTGDKIMVPAVDVLGEPVGERTTDANGRYLFDNLPTGTYEVKYTLTETQSNVYMFTEPTVAAATVGTDSNAHVPTVAPGDPAPVRTSGTSAKFDLDDTTVVDSTSYTDQAFTATQGIDPTWDAGVHLMKVSVGDRVWVDQNRDGIQDTDSNDNYTEPGIPGVVLEIVRVDKDGKEHPVTDVYGDPVGQETTGPDGDYEFSDLPALDDNESYKVTIVTTDPSTQAALAPYVPTLPGEGTDRGANSSTGSELAPADGLQTDGAKDDTLDFGFVVPSYAVGDRVWIDVDRDGIQDAGEVDLAGVTVTLLDASTGLPVAEDILGKEIKPQVTGKDGLYMFDNLPAGSYKVQFELTAKQGEKYQFTTNVAGANSVDNSDGVVGTNPLVATTGVIVLDATNAALDTEYSVKHLASQGVDPTWDAGVHLKKVSVGDYVWFDADKDGVQDGNEKGIKDVLLNLTDKNGKPVVDVYGNEVQPVRTDANGKYTFENLPALAEGEQYIVVIDETDAATEQALLGLMPTLEGKGTPEMDSSSWFAIATFDGLTLDGDRNPTLDFGFVIDPDFDAFGEDETRDETEDGAGSGDSDSAGSTKLPATGFGGLAAGAFGVLLLAAGALLVAMRRRV